MKRVKDNVRRHPRLRYSGPVRLFWDDACGRTRYVPVLSLDISENGLKIDSLESIPVSTRVSLRAELIEFAGAAIVRRIELRGARFEIGLELGPSLMEQVLKLTKDPALLVTPGEI